MATATYAHHQLANAIQDARRQSDELFRLISPAGLFDRPIAERHRLIFYLGHLEAFDWNQVARAALGIPSFQPEFDRLFEFGIDPAVGTNRRTRRATGRRQTRSGRTIGVFVKRSMACWSGHRLRHCTLRSNIV